MKSIHVLSVFRSSLLDNRGTPLRVKSLIKEGLKQNDFVWSTATLDTASPLGLSHVTLTHAHFQDIRAILQFVRQQHVDVIVFHSVAAAFYVPFIVPFTRAKIVLEMHGFREEEEFLYGRISRPKYVWDRFVNGCIYRLSDLITTCSVSATEYLKRYKKNVVSVYGGVDLTLFNPQVASGGYIQREPGTIIVGYAGDGKKWQGLPFLYTAFDALHEKYPEFRLELLLSEKRTVPNKSYIHVTDALPHEKVASFLIDCDALVIPRIKSRVNDLTYPSKFMEYMAMGKCVVVSRTSDMHTIIVDGENGTSFNPEDVEGFVQAMAALKDDVLRKKIGEGAYNTASTGYTWEVQGKVFIDAIKALMK